MASNEDLLEVLKIKEAETPLELGIKAGAANECLRAKTDAYDEYQNIVKKFGEIPQANDWKAASQVLEKLLDLLSRATDKEMSMLQEAQSAVGDGSKILEIRQYACQKIDLFGSYLEEPGAPSADPIIFKAKKAINREI